MRLFISQEGLDRYARARDPALPQKDFLWTTDFTVELPILLTPKGHGSQTPVTLIQQFASTAEKHGQKPALSRRVGGKWQTLTFKEYYDQSLLFGRALLASGIPGFRSVNINGFNSPEWCIAFYGAMFAQCFPVGVYTTNNTQACLYVAQHSECQCLVLQNKSYLEKYLPVLDKITGLKAIVLYQETQKPVIPGNKVPIYLWQEFLALGAKQKPDTGAGSLSERMNGVKPGHCCTIVYTSGTTGPPKGVLLSHDNYVFNMRYMIDKNSHIQDWRVLSYLPLSHVAGQALDLVGGIMAAAHVYFADPTALQGSLVGYMKDVRPNIFLSVPRVWQKIEEQMKLMAAGNGFIKRKIAEWAKAMGAAGTYAEQNNKEPPAMWWLAKTVVFDKVKEALGMDQVRLFLYGAAPLSASIREYFMSLNFFLVNVYGMSECAGPECMTQADKFDRFDSAFMSQAGFPIEGTDLKIADPDKDGSGQICWRGRNRFMGYFKDLKETQATIDKDGYLKSGDVGKVDSKGVLFITGRIKELLITAGGQNVAPVLIENAVKEALPFLSNCVVVGDKLKYLACLLTLKCDDKGAILPECVAQLQQRGVSVKTTKQAIGDAALRAVIEKGIAQANKKAISKAQALVRWVLLEQDFTIDRQTVTPTMKLRRKEINRRYEKEIGSLYEAKGAL